MSRSPCLPLAFALAALAGCEDYGVSLGGEEACEPELRLTSERLRNAEPLSRCAELGENVVVNGGFEAPIVADDCRANSFCHFAANDVPGWSTSSAAGLIELWDDGHRDVHAAAGTQFGELDATSPDTLWQDFTFPPGQLLYWSLLHRGRNGVERIDVELGPPSAPALSVRISSAPGDWYEHSGLYRVGEDERVTRLALVSRSGVTEGNLVDEVTLAPVIEHPRR